jgi:hypothetical protein
MAGQHPHYHKWLRYYLDFCHNYSFSPTDRLTLPAFQEKLRAKHQSESLCQQAEHAVSLYWEMVSSTATEPCLAADAATQQGVETRNAALATLESAPSQSPVGKPPTESPLPPSPTAKPTLRPEETIARSPHSPVPSQPSPRPEKAAVGRVPDAPANPVRALSQNDQTDSAGFKLTGASWVWVYDGLTSAIKVRHYSPKTLEAYKIWTQKFQTFTQSKNPRRVSMDDIKGFLSFLAVTKKSRRPARTRPCAASP